MSNIVEGIGKDAPIETNSLGGKQSACTYALELFDPQVLYSLLNICCTDDIPNILYNFASTENEVELLSIFTTPTTVDEECDCNLPFKRILTVSKVLKEGAEKYDTNNWRLIPQEEHFRHALVHYLAYRMGDTQDEHFEHFLTRIMMAMATERSEGFSYSKYIAKQNTI